MHSFQVLTLLYGINAELIPESALGMTIKNSTPPPASAALGRPAIFIDFGGRDVNIRMAVDVKVSPGLSRQIEMCLLSQTIKEEIQKAVIPQNVELEKPE